MRPEFVYELHGGHSNGVNIARFSPNGLMLATGGADQQIYIWSLRKVPVEFGATEKVVKWG